MYKAFKYRLKPTGSQKELIAKHIGSCRLVYNLSLDAKQTAYRSNANHSFSAFDLIKQMPDLKKEYDFLKEVNAQSLNQSILNMDNAYKKFFKGAGFPKFKSKHRGAQSFTAPSDVKVVGNRLKLIKFKEGIAMVVHREIEGTIKSATVSRAPSGKYFASILVDTKKEMPAKADIKDGTAVGIHLGIKSFLTTSKGIKIDNPKNLRHAQRKLKYVQRKYSKHKGKRTKRRLALIHEKVANRRKDFLHNVSATLIRENQTICVKDLNVKGMVKTHWLAQSIMDASWSSFVDMLKYKADWTGKNLLQIGRFEPSSKTCSKCGDVKEDMTLAVRKWTCKSCGSKWDRDINAAMNIKSFALDKHMTGPPSPQTRNELPAWAGRRLPKPPIFSGWFTSIARKRVGGRWGLSSCKVSKLFFFKEVLDNPLGYHGICNLYKTSNVCTLHIVNIYVVTFSMLYTMVMDFFHDFF